MTSNHRTESYEICAQHPGRKKRKILFSVDEAPHPVLWPVFGIQQTLLCITGVLTAPVLVAVQLGVTDMPEVRREILSIALFTCGVATILQNVFGSRLPIIQGANITFIVPIAAIFSLAKWKDENLITTVLNNNGTTDNAPWKLRMREIQGNMMLASATELLMGASGLAGFLLKFIGPLTIAPSLSVIGLSVGQFVLPLCEQHWGLAFASMALLVTFVLFVSGLQVPIPAYSRQKGCHRGRFPVFELVPVLLAVGLVWFLSYVLTITDSLPNNSTLPGYKARTDVRTRGLYEAPWFYFPMPFQFGTPTFSVAGYIGMLTATLSSMVESIGDYFAAARVAEATPPPAHAVNRGIAAEGFSSVFGGMIGGLCASTSYSENIGAIAVTKIASRKVFVTAGFLLMLAGVIGKIGALFTLIPDPIIGGVSLVTLGMVTAVGVSTLQFVDLNSSRNLMVVGVAMMMGLKIPDWMNAHPGAIDSGSEIFDQIVTILLSSPMFVAGFIGCLLDNLAPGTNEERGLIKWRQNTTSVEDPNGVSTYDIPYITQLLRKVKCCFYFPLSPTYVPTFRCSCPCKKKHCVQHDINGDYIDVESERTTSTS